MKQMIDEIQPNKISIRLENGLFNISSWMEKSKFLTSIKQAFVLTIPIFMIGAIITLVLNIPIPAVNNFIRTIWNGKLADCLMYIYNATFSIAALYVLITLTYIYSSNFTEKRSMTNLVICMVAIGSYFALLGIDEALIINDVSHTVVRLEFINVANIFAAMIVSFTSTRLFLLISRLTLRRKSKYNLTTEVDYRDAISAIFPMLITIAVFALSAELIKIIFNVNSFNEMITMILTFPFKQMGRSLLSAVLILFMQTFLWFFGVHGSNVFENVNQDIFVNSVVQGDIITKSFLDSFVLMGGCGASMCLLIAIFIFSRSKEDRSIAKKSALPMLFNINEIFVFGLPIVLNPVFLIPFLLVPLVTLLTSYLAVFSGLVPPVILDSSITWTTPVLISGYGITGSVSGIFLQLFNLAIGVLIYWPFVKMNGRIQKRKNDLMINAMIEELREADRNGEKPNLLYRNDYLSRAANDLANKLRRAIEKDEVNIFYQPLIGENGEVLSSEALLRWKGDSDNFIFPPLLVAIAKEDNTFDVLTQYIIERVLKDIKAIQANLDINFGASVNIQNYQLNNSEFISWVIEKVNEFQLPTNSFGLEVTEESELQETENLHDVFIMLNEAGIKISIDDFSMGHTSLNYLKTNSFDYVKLDGTLTKGLLINERTREIVETIIKLGETLGFGVVAEFVETEEQRNILHQMGCNIYQGWLYSPAISFDELIVYLKNKIDK